MARIEQQFADLQVIPREGQNTTMEEQLLLQEYRNEQLEVRKELREVRYQQQADIAALGRTVKAFNLLVMPLLLVGMLLLVNLHQRSKRSNTV